MANICSCELEITGDKSIISILTKKIEDQDEELLELFCWFTFAEDAESDYGMYTFQDTEESINLSFCSKNNFPSQFEKLVAAFPRLNFRGSYEEAGCEIYGKVSAIDGKITSTSLTPMEYYTEFYEDFAEERYRIEKLPYKKFLIYALEDEVDYQNYMYSYLEEIMLKRIKDEDLPLLIAHSWEHCKDAFTQRLKGE